MAEAIFNNLRPTGFRAISAGTQPAREVSPLVIDALEEIGIDAKGAKPKSITAEMLVSAEKIVTMGCEASGFCPAKFLPKVEDWGIEDPRGKSLDQIRSIRDKIRERVRDLIHQLAHA